MRLDYLAAELYLKEGIDFKNSPWILLTIS